MYHKATCVTTLLYTFLEGIARTLSSMYKLSYFNNWHVYVIDILDE